MMFIIERQMTKTELDKYWKEYFITIITEVYGGQKCKHEVNDCNVHMVIDKIPGDELFHHYELTPRKWSK